MPPSWKATLAEHSKGKVVYHWSKQTSQTVGSQPANDEPTTHTPISRPDGLHGYQTNLSQATNPSYAYPSSQSYGSSQDYGQNLATEDIVPNEERAQVSGYIFPRPSAERAYGDGGGSDGKGIGGSNTMPRRR